MSELLTVGTEAPDFTLTAYNGETVKLSNFRGRKNVVLVFYPKNHTPGCNRQLSSLRDDRERFAAADTEILSVNPASIEAHTKYRDKKGFNFDMLSDPGRDAAAKYRALKENGKSIRRTVYIVDKKGVIRFAERGMPADERMLEAIGGFPD